MVTTPIGHQDEDIPKEGDLHNVPLHSNDKTTLSHCEYSILLRNSCWQLFKIILWGIKTPSYLLSIVGTNVQIFVTIGSTVLGYC